MIRFRFGSHPVEEVSPWGGAGDRRGCIGFGLTEGWLVEYSVKVEPR
jgi:hypothetical protein